MLFGECLLSGHHFMFKAPFFSLSMGREGMGYVRNAAVVWWLLVRIIVLCYTLREKLHEGSQGMVSQTLLAVLMTTKVEGSMKTGKTSMTPGQLVCLVADIPLLRSVFLCPIWTCQFFWMAT